MVISVALCTFNGIKYLQEQLDSILNQSLPVNEIIICDDNSTDRTVKILKEYQRLYPDLIYLFFNRSSLGTIKNFEKAISLSKGDLIFLSDQDDIWKKDKVKTMVSFFQENISCKLLFTNGSLINENGKDLGLSLWEKWRFNQEKRDQWKNNNFAFKDLIINNNRITGATICFHRDLKSICLPINVPYGYWHDAWLGLHASASDGLFFMEKCLIKYRIHPEQQVGTSSNVSKDVILKANTGYISNMRFYKKIQRTYPEKKELIPSYQNRKFLNKILKTIIKRFDF